MTVLISIFCFYTIAPFSKNIYVCTYIYFRFTGNIFMNEKTIVTGSHDVIFSGDLNDLHAA